MRQACRCLHCCHRWDHTQRTAIVLLPGCATHHHHRGIQRVPPAGHPAPPLGHLQAPYAAVHSPSDAHRVADAGVGARQPEVDGGVGGDVGVVAGQAVPEAGGWAGAGLGSAGVANWAQRGQGRGRAACCAWAPCMAMACTAAAARVAATTWLHWALPQPGAARLCLLPRQLQATSRSTCSPQHQQLVPAPLTCSPSLTAAPAAPAPPPGSS